MMPEQLHLMAGLAAGALAIPLGWLAAAWARRQAQTVAFTFLALILAMALAAIWASVVMPLTWLLLPAILLGWVLCILAAVDLLAFRLPDVLTLPLIGAGLLLSVWLPDRDPLGHGLGAAAAFAFFYVTAVGYERLRGREGLGLGDAKLAAAAGAWLGWQALPAMVLIACAGAFVWIGVAVATRGRAAAGEQIAFGVPLCIAFWLVWLYGAPL